MPANPAKRAPISTEGATANALMSTVEVAAYLCVSEHTVRSWRRRKVALRWIELPSLRDGGPGFVRYRLADVVALVLARMQEVDRPVGSRPGPAIHKGLILLPASEGARHQREMLRAKHNLRKGRRRAERKAAGEGEGEGEADHG